MGVRIERGDDVKAIVTGKDGRRFTVRGQVISLMRPRKRGQAGVVTIHTANGKAYDVEYRRAKPVA